MTKDVIFLTDITLHTREYRQTTNFSKAAKRGRMYTPLPAPTEPATRNRGNLKPGEFEFVITLPPDLQEKWKRGDVIVMVPKEGLPVFAGRDIDEKLAQLRQKERRGLIHCLRSWFPGKEGV